MANHNFNNNVGFGTLKICLPVLAVFLSGCASDERNEVQDNIDRVAARASFLNEINTQKKVAGIPENFRKEDIQKIIAKEVVFTQTGKILDTLQIQTDGNDSLYISAKMDGEQESRTLKLGRRYNGTLLEYGVLFPQPKSVSDVKIFFTAKSLVSRKAQFRFFEPGKAKFANAYDKKDGTFLVDIKPAP